MRYKVKNFNSKQGLTIQKDVSNWIKTRKHVTIVSTNIWSSDSENFATITYVENQYEM